MNEIYYLVTFERYESKQSVTVVCETNVSLDKVVKMARGIFRRQIIPRFCSHIVDEYSLRSIEVV